MLISYHFPVFDLSQFTDHRSNQSAYPEWPRPASIVDEIFEDKSKNPNKAFQICLGPIEKRNKGGINGWIEEHFQCHVTSIGIKTPPVVYKKEITFETNSTSTVSVFREETYYLRQIFFRYFYDGTSVGKYDIGFRFGIPRKQDSFILHAINSIENSKISSKHFSCGVDEFGNLSRRLSDLYSSSKVKSDLNSKNDLVHVGKPLRMLIARNADIERDSPEQFLRKYCDRNFHEFSWSIYRGGQIAFIKEFRGLATFILFPSKDRGEEIALRECRIAFGRIYSEVFGFFVASKLIREKLRCRLDDTGEQKMLVYLNAVSSRLTGSNRPKGRADEVFYNHILSCFFELFHPGLLSEVVDRAKSFGARPNLSRSIERLRQLSIPFNEENEKSLTYIGEFNMTKQTGIEVSGENAKVDAQEINIAQVLNSASSADIVSEIKRLLESDASIPAEDAKILRDAKEKAKNDNDGWKSDIAKVSLETLKKAVALGLPIITALLKKQLGL